MKRFISITLLVLTTLLAGCGQVKDIKDTAPVTIGVIMPLTGETGVHGVRIKKAIDLAANKINATGGINGRPLTVLYEDSRCLKNDGVAAAQKFIHQDKLKALIVGCSAVSVAVAPIAEEAGVVMISPLASAPDLKQAGDFIFRNRVSGEVHGKEMARFAYHELGARTAGILYINLDNGVGYRDAFISEFEQLGGAILASEAHEQGAKDFRTQLAKIKQTKPDVIYFPGQGNEEAFNQARELGITAQFLGMIGFENPETLSIAKESADGTYYTYSAYKEESDIEYIKQFQQAYKEAYGESASAFAANGYDALYLLAKGIERCGEVPTCMRDYLYEIENYPGVSGNTTFDEYGEVIKPIMVKQLKDGEFIEVK